MFYSPDSLLHISTENDITLRVGSWDDVCLIILAVSHHILVDVRCLGKQNLASSGVALGILDSLQGTSSIAGAVKDYLCVLAEEAGGDIRDLFANDTNSVLLLESLKKIAYMHRGVEGYCGELDTTCNTFW